MAAAAAPLMVSTTWDPSVVLWVDGIDQSIEKTKEWVVCVSPSRASRAAFWERNGPVGRLAWCVCDSARPRGLSKWTSSAPWFDPRLVGLSIDRQNQSVGHEEGRRACP